MGYWCGNCSCVCNCNGCHGRRICSRCRSCCHGWKRYCRIHNGNNCCRQCLHWLRNSIRDICLNVCIRCPHASGIFCTRQLGNSCCNRWWCCSGGWKCVYLDSHSQNKDLSLCQQRRSAKYSKYRSVPIISRRDGKQAIRVLFDRNEAIRTNDGAEYDC